MSESEQYSAYEGNVPISFFFCYSTSKFSFFNFSLSQSHEKFSPWNLNSQGNSKPYPVPAMHVQYNTKATSNNPLMDNTVKSGLKALKYFFWCIIHECPLAHFFSPSCRQTPPVSGHLPLVQWVSAYGRFDCTFIIWRVLRLHVSHLYRWLRRNNLTSRKPVTFWSL